MIIQYNASKEERDRITAEREKKLYQSFENMRKKIDDQIQTMNFSTVSERVKRQQLEEIRNELQKQLQSHYNALESGLKDDMVNIGQQVLNESETFYKGLNMPIGMSITSFPVEIMNNVVNGSVYQEKWYLSRALWGDYTEKLDQINEVISNGIGLNLPSFEIAKQLEQYVDPSAMTPSKTIVTKCLQDPVSGKLYSMDYVKRHPEKDWTGFKEKDSKFRYGKVDYNAQRLARTLINHAYQQNVVHQAQANPFATGVRWDASGGERMCEICEERDGKIFPVDDVPLDHPNGMCTFSVETPSMMEMSNTLADWVNGEPTDWDDQLNAYYEGRPIEHKVESENKYKAFEKSAPVRQRRSDFGDNYEAYEKAREQYRHDLEEYQKYLMDAAKNQVGESALPSVDYIIEKASRVGISISAYDLGSVDLRIVDRYLDQFEVLDNRFPEVKEFYERFGAKWGIHYVDDSSFLAEAMGGMTFGKVWEDAVRGAVMYGEALTGFNVYGDGTINTMFTHEFGHYAQVRIESMIADRFHMSAEDTNWRDNFSTLDDYKRAREEYLHEREQYEKELFSLSRLEGCSEYAKTNDAELFAEGFAAYTLGEKTEFAEKFGEFFDRWYNR